MLSAFCGKTHKMGERDSAASRVASFPSSETAETNCCKVVVRRRVFRATTSRRGAQLCCFYPSVSHDLAAEALFNIAPCDGSTAQILTLYSPTVIGLLVTMTSLEVTHVIWPRGRD